MPTFRTAVDAQGRVTLPPELVERLGIAPGETVEFFLTLDGQVHFHVINGDFGTRIGRPGRARPPLSIREIDDTIADHLAAEDDRIRAQAGRAEGRPADRSAAE